MRFATLSTLLLAFALGLVLAEQAAVLPQEPHNMQCGIPSEWFRPSLTCNHTGSER